VFCKVYLDRETLVNLNNGDILEATGESVNRFSYGGLAVLANKGTSDRLAVGYTPIE